MKPTFKMSVGSLNIDSTQITLPGLAVAIVVDLQLDAPNIARISLDFHTDTSIVPGDAVEIQLGLDGAQKVFSGVVQEITKGIQGPTIYCQSGLAALINDRLNKLYEKQKAGDIVNDLAQKAGLSTATVESGFEFPVYVLGDDQSAFEHILHLARRNGFDCYADVDDKLIFAAYQGNTVHPFQYALDILDLNLDQAQNPVSGVEVYGSSPSSHGQGAEAYSWFTKKEVKGSAGTTSGLTLRLSDPTLKDLESAGSVAQAILERVSRSKSGSLKALGSAKAQLGDAIQISDMPDSSLDGTYKITGVKHVLNKARGYTTVLHWTES